jgi:hypothetical protein
MDSDTNLPPQPETLQNQSIKTSIYSNLPNLFKKFIFALGIYLLIVAPTFYALLDAQKVFGIDVDSWYVGWKMLSLTSAGVIFWIALLRKKRLWFYILFLPFLLLTGWAIITDIRVLRPIRLEVYFWVNLFTIGLLLLAKEYYSRFMLDNESRPGQPGGVRVVNSSRWRRIAITIAIIIVIIVFTTGTIGYLLELKTYPLTTPSTQQSTQRNSLPLSDFYLTVTARPTYATPWPTSTQASPTPILVMYRNEKLGFEFKHLEGYHVMEETANKVSFGFTYPAITISTNQITDYKSYKLCDEANKQTPCLENGERWGQKGDAAETKLGNINAKSFYIVEDYPYRYNPYTPAHTVYHIVQSNDTPKIEVKMHLSNSGPEAFDLAFKQMLSTFKLLDM